MSRSMYKSLLIFFILLAVAMLIYALDVNKPAKTTRKAVSITVFCKDGSSYTDSSYSVEEFKCDWKRLEFNY